MSRLPLYFSLAAILLAGVRAEEPAGKSDEKPKNYELKNRSSFGLDLSSRTPFWPIGWKRTDAATPVSRAVVPKAPVAKFNIKEQGAYFEVTSLLLGNPPLATINRRAYGEGEFLPVEVGGQPIKVVVKLIRDGGVILEHEGNQLFVPMKRLEPGPKAATPANLPPPVFKIVIPELK
jgi:hypothetical protein